MHRLLAWVSLMVIGSLCSVIVQKEYGKLVARTPNGVMEMYGKCGQKYNPEYLRIYYGKGRKWLFF